MYGVNKKKRNQPHFQTQFTVANINSGCLVTFNDDGADRNTGAPGQQRRHAWRKLNAEDEDGDPLFVVVDPLPDHVRNWDSVCEVKIGKTPRLADRSRNSEFSSLQEKFDANKQAREQFQNDALRKRLNKQAPSAQAESALDAAKNAAKSKADKAAARMVRTPKKSSAPASEPAE